MRAVQEELQPLEGTRLPAAAGYDLWNRQWEAAWRFAGVLSAGPGPYVSFAGFIDAKAVQLEVSDGRPLTVCVGKRWYDFPPLADMAGPGVFIPHGDGCHLVYPDSVSTRGRGLRLFRQHCPACRRRATLRRQAAVHRSRAFEAGRELVVAGYDEAGAPVEMWWGRCACGEMFLSRRPDTTRCASCGRRRPKG
jgi:hypothetical protein